jgi:hypothetical protein
MGEEPGYSAVFFFIRYPTLVERIYPAVKTFIQDFIDLAAPST